jgi:histidine ammonia-lyase
VHARVRQQVPAALEDRLFAPDLEAARALVLDGALCAGCGAVFAALRGD